MSGLGIRCPGCPIFDLASPALSCTLVDMLNDEPLKWVASRVAIGILAAAAWPSAYSEGAERVLAIGVLFALGCLALHLAVADAAEAYKVVIS